MSHIAQFWVMNLISDPKKPTTKARQSFCNFENLRKGSLNQIQIPIRGQIVKVRLKNFSTQAF